jgi:hypothetical protein
MERGRSKDVRSEPRPINPIINIIINPLIHLLNLVLQLLGKKIQLLILILHQIVKRMVEHADNLTTLIADNLLLLLVVQRRDGKPAFVVRTLRKVNVAEMRVVWMQRIRRSIISGDVLIRGRESPALLSHVPVYAGEADDVFETLEAAHDQSSVGPWTCVANIKVVAIFLGWEFGIGLVLDP